MSSKLFRTFVLKYIEQNKCSCYSGFNNKNKRLGDEIIMLRYSTYESIYKTTSERNTHTYLWRDRVKSVVPRSFIKISIWMLLLVTIGSSGMIQAFANSSEEVRVDKNVIVLYGDTLWSIAVQEKPTNMDTRVYIKKLKQLNGLTSGNIMAGEVLKLPVY